MFIDSHCHLDDPKFVEDFADILHRAKIMNVQRLLTISTLLSAVPGLQKISDDHPHVYHSVGVHPNDVQQEGVPTGAALKKFAQHPKAVAFGETGLDYYYEHTDRKAQQESFLHHIQAAHELNMPLIIHSRDAEEDILSILKSHKLAANPGVIHCFTGTENFAKDCLDLGFYISISGIVTFKNAEALREIVKIIPQDRLLIETDSPYLAPMPYRGKRNEPSYVVYTAEAIANLLDMSTQKLGEITSHNFFTLFSKAS